MAPRISIILPAYNAANRIGQAIESVLNQTLRDLELICVDDGSTDATAETIRAYAAKDARVRLVAHDGNRGILMTRQTGVTQASGQYIMCLDSDDQLEPHACATALEAIERAGADMLHFGTNYQGREGFQTAAEAIFQRDSDGGNGWEGTRAGVDLLEAFFIAKTLHWSVWSKICTAALAKKVYALFGDERCDMAEDAMITFLMLANAPRVAYLADKLYIYHIGIGITADVSVAKARAVATEYRVYQLLMQGLTAQQQGDPRIAAAAAALHDELLDAVMWNLMHLRDPESYQALKTSLSRFIGEDALIMELQAYTARLEKHWEEAEKHYLRDIKTLQASIIEDHAAWSANEAHYLADIAALQDQIAASQALSAEEHAAWADSEAHYLADIAALQSAQRHLEDEKKKLENHMQWLRSELDMEKRKGLIAHARIKWALEHPKS